MSAERVHELLADVEFRDWWWRVGDDGGSLWLQVAFEADCHDTGDRCEQRGRKWRLSEYMTDGEVVQTAFLAVLTALEHEAREEFLYRGAMIFGPHHDLDALVEAAGRTEVRA